MIWLLVWACCFYAGIAGTWIVLSWLDRRASRPTVGVLPRTMGCIGEPVQKGAHGHQPTGPVREWMPVDQEVDPVLRPVPALWQRRTYPYGPSVYLNVGTGQEVPVAAFGQWVSMQTPVAPATPAPKPPPDDEPGTWPELEP